MIISRGPTIPKTPTAAAPRRKDFLSQIGLFLCLFLAMFSNLEVQGFYFQIASVLCLCFTAFVIGGNPIERMSRSGRTFGMVLILVCLFSIMSFLFFIDTYSLSYTLVYLAAILASWRLAVRISWGCLLSTTQFLYFFMICLLCVIDPHEIMAALDISQAMHWASRYRPLNNHPNLAGIIFGQGFIITAYGVLINKGVKRYINLFSSFGCLIVMLATMSRAPLFALFISSSLCFLFSFKKLSTKQKMIVWVCGIVCALFMIAYIGKITGYLGALLELSSTSRGLDSGGTGRTLLWQQGIDYLFSNPLILLMGGGLRFATVDHVGFSTENSYITIMLESGIFLSTLIFASIGACLLTAYRTYQKSTSFLDLALFNILLYMVIESIFNRYLLSIGNPASIIFTILCLRAGNKSNADQPSKQKLGQSKRGSFQSGDD